MNGTLFNNNKQVVLNIKQAVLTTIIQKHRMCNAHRTLALMHIAHWRYAMWHALLSGLNRSVARVRTFSTGSESKHK
jgi:hypothetical protein